MNISAAYTKVSSIMINERFLQSNQVCDNRRY
jgi:hypothetical protein